MDGRLPLDKVGGRGSGFSHGKDDELSDVINVDVIEGTPTSFYLVTSQLNSCSLTFAVRQRLLGGSFVSYAMLIIIDYEYSFAPFLTCCDSQLSCKQLHMNGICTRSEDSSHSHPILRVHDSDYEIVR